MSQSLTLDQLSEEMLPKHIIQAINQVAVESVGKVRLILDLPPDLNQRLEELADREGLTVSDVLSKAIALLYVAVGAKEAGLRLGIIDSDKPTLVREIIGI